MSAIPKKKLCWNCEGIVSKDIDNCPYCAVYLHATDSTEEKETPFWNPYRANRLDEDEEQAEEEEEKSETRNPLSFNFSTIFSSAVAQKFKQDVLSILFLMTGSLFFLFGTILFLFSDEKGFFTLQWKADNWGYFLCSALFLLYFGWRFLQQLEDKNNPSI